MIIDKFRGEYGFLSNMHNCKITYQNLTYLNAEAAFQSFKTLNLEEREEFTKLDGKTAKSKGRKVSLRADWNEVKDRVMLDVVRCKFEQNPNLKKKLIDTYPAIIIESNIWGDKYWGACNGEGKNKLGRMLMKIREDFRLK